MPRHAFPTATGILRFRGSMCFCEASSEEIRFPFANVIV